MMDDSVNKPGSGSGIHQGADHSSPYPVSRLAPAFDLVDLAQDLQQSEEMLSSRVNAKLQLIASQVRQLQAAARQILQEAQDEQQLHRAKCSFRQIPGKTYHLYRETGGNLAFSMLSPEDWRGQPPHEFVGSYRLEADRSWTAIEEIEAGKREQQDIRGLLGLDPAQED